MDVVEQPTQSEKYRSDSDFDVSTITATTAENNPYHQSDSDEVNVMSVNDH